jgi:2-polyprenyl-3-methyl-5-hydroxy-6-metoxy-1,4-benzoquinol methylase
VTTVSLTSSRAVERGADGPVANPISTVLCPLCESDHLSATPSIPGRVRCGCGMVYSTDPSSVCQSRFFESEYSDAKRLEKFYGHQRGKQFRRVIARVSRLVERPERWLDIGCGPGDLLLEASARGWECTGIDSSPLAVAMARQRGLQTFLGCFPEEIPESDVEYDAISIVHMIEEVQDPKSVLRECKKRLSSNGVLVLEVKNFCFWVHAERFFRSRDGIWCPLDIRTYSLSTIAQFLQVTGFKLITVIPSGLKGSLILAQLFSIGVAITGRAYSPSITVIARG